jgi:peroxiredoxin family protein
LDALTGLSQAGVDLIACTTCMNYYDIKQDAIIGRVGDMNEVISLLLTSEKVITP